MQNNREIDATVPGLGQGAGRQLALSMNQKKKAKP
jgi:hypothetical protein